MISGSNAVERNKNNEVRLTTMKGQNANFISLTTPVASLSRQIKYAKPWKSGCSFGAKTGIQIRSRSGFSEAGDRCEKEESGYCLKSPNRDSFEDAGLRKCCNAASDPTTYQKFLIPCHWHLALSSGS